MDIYLSFDNNKESIRLPVLPSSFTLSKANTNTVVNINSIGDINLIGKTGLNEITIESFFPNQEYSFCLYNGFPKPKECVSTIEKWMRSGKPIRLIITETSINYAMAIENFQYGEEDGSGDVKFSLSLKEYKFIKATSVTTQKIKTQNGTTIKKPVTKRETKQVGTKYTVKKGDTLGLIAKKTTGDWNNYKAIAKANNITNPNKLKVGQVIVI